MCTYPRASVADYWDGEDWLIPFRRSLTTSERGCLEELHSWLCQSPLEAGQDDILWALDKSKAFTTNSLYSFLTNRGVVLKPSVNFWNARIPLKIKIFLWQVDNDRLQSAMTLKYRGWQGSHLCCLCQQPETTNHIVLSKKKNNEPHLVRVFHGPILMERGWGDLRLDRPTEVLGGLPHYLDLQELQNA